MSTFSLNPALASRNDESLTERMPMPCRPRTWLESNAGSLNKRRILLLKKRIHPNIASKPVRRSLDRRLRTDSFDFHILYSLHSVLFTFLSNDLSDGPDLLIAWLS
jgi:hypothetical protein